MALLAVSIITLATARTWFCQSHACAAKSSGSIGRIGSPTCSGSPSESDSVSWSLLGQQAQLELSNCDSIATGYLEASACFAGRHIVFMGDSLSRYQYLNLVNLLEARNWSLCDATPISESEKNWGNWHGFYTGTNSRLHGNEICDCWRQNDYWGPGWADSSMENRFYYNPSTNIRVTYIQMLGLLPSRHSNLTWLNVACDMKPESQRSQCMQTGCFPGECGSLDMKNRYAVVRAEDAILYWASALPVIDVLLFNIGIWDDITSNTAFIASLLNSASTARQQKKIKRIVWKSTTTTRDSARYRVFEKEKAFYSVLQNSSWGLFDTSVFTRDVNEVFDTLGLSSPFIDTFHYVPAVYRGLNQALVAEMCYSNSPFGMILNQ